MPSVRRRVERRRFVARGVPVTQASGRVRLERLTGTAGVRRGGVHAGRPDNINVWHAVSGDKALRAK